MMRIVVVFVVLLGLSACGGTQMLKPKAGASLPPKPEFAAVPTPDELMTAEDQARPQRNDELLQKSEKRRDDKFDLPPTG